MKIKVNSKQLVNFLKACKLKNNSLSVFSCAKIEAAGKLIRVTITDLDNFAIANIQGSIEEPGTAIIERKDLLDALKASGEIAAIEASEKTEKQTQKDEEIEYTVYSVKIGHATVSGYSPDEFPSLPEFKTEFALTFSGYLIHELKSAINYAGNDELRPVTMGCFIEGNGSEVTLTATDSHRLFSSKIGASDAKFGCILSKQGCKLLLDLSEKRFPEVSLEQSEKHARFTFENYEVYTRLIEGKFPNWRAVVPNPENDKIVGQLNVSDWVSNIEKIKFAASKSTNLLRVLLNSEEQTVKFTCEDFEFKKKAESQTSMAFDSQLDELEFGINLRFFCEMTKTMVTSFPTIYLQAPNKPIVMKELTRTYLLMPVTLNP